MEIIINVSGGIVQDVFCSNPEANLTVINWDTEGALPNEPGIVEVKTTGGRAELAYLARYQPLPLSDHVGTDAQRAIKAANVVLDDEPLDRRFVLYDFDADELATSQLYRDRAEACRNADELDNVMVLAVPIPGPANGE